MIRKKITLLCFSLFFCSLLPAQAQKTKFRSDFAPSESIVKPMERPYRDAVCLNGKWDFSPVDNAGKLSKDKITNPDMPDASSWENTPVKVPSPWNVNNFATDNNASGGDFVTYPSYPKKWESIKAGWLKRQVPYRKEWKGKRLILRFDAVGGYTQVFINDRKVGENFDVFLPFEIDVTNALKVNEDNTVMLWVADGQLLNQPGKYGRRLFVGGSFWGQHVRGIWQDVNLLVKPATYVKDTYIQAVVDSDLLRTSVTLNNTTDAAQEVSIGGDVSPWINQAGKNVVEAPEPKWQSGNPIFTLPVQRVKVPAQSQVVVQVAVKVNQRLNKWTSESPDLYGLLITATTNGHVMDKQYTRFGWRQYTIVGNQFLLNGKPVVLKGDSWHFMGIPQMTRRYAWSWYSMLKNAHANAVRLHAEPYPAFYLDMADEMGICVLDETGMWASDGGPKIDAEEYWSRSEDHLKRFVLRDRNHPSVFGWSVCNENLPVAMGVFHGPDSLVKRQVLEIDRWMDIARALDPSRTWVSGDGETQASLNSPVIIGHYGGSEDNYRSLSSKGKVWGIGEAGMAYYATPAQSAVYNGNRSYESQLGRMEGIALESTKLINMLKKYNASYMSIFNLVWYGLKPLELGLKDTTKAPRADDGIFFSDYQEGKPGVQPERLGPYTTTLNPGYDPSLPLYKTWPLFDAIKASFKDAEPQPFAVNIKDEEKAKSAVTTMDVTLLSSDRDSTLSKIFAGMGVVLNKPHTDKKTLMILDGAHMPDKNVLQQEKNVLQNGGNVLIWAPRQASLKEVNQYLPQTLELTDRKATSFITQKFDNVLSGLGNADFYFSEITDNKMMNDGLSGEFVRNGNVLLDACNTDWRAWNKRAEYLKTASVLRSERESKPEGKALVEMNADRGKIYVLALDPVAMNKSSVSVIRKMFYNLGVSFENIPSNNIAAIDASGNLNHALTLASFNIAGKNNDEIYKSSLPGNTKPTAYYAGQEVNQHLWEKTDAEDGVFDFSKIKFSGPTNDAEAYLSFWIYSPRSLSNLLLEPDMPRLEMYVGADDPFQVLLNNQVIKQAGNSGSFAKPGLVSQAILLEKGWNHFLIKTTQKNGPWKLSVKFDCDKKDFLKNDLKSQIAHLN